MPKKREYQVYDVRIDVVVDASGGNLVPLRTETTTTFSVNPDGSKEIQFTFPIHVALQDDDVIRTDAIGGLRGYEPGNTYGLYEGSFTIVRKQKVIQKLNIVHKRAAAA